MSEEELPLFFELADSTVTYVKHCFDQDIKDDVADLLEHVLQFAIIVLDATNEKCAIIIQILRQLTH